MQNFPAQQQQMNMQQGFRGQVSPATQDPSRMRQQSSMSQTMQVQIEQINGSYIQKPNTPPSQIGASHSVQVQLNPNELNYYQKRFADVDISNRGTITGKEAVPYFLKSGLQRDILKSIWLMSSKNNSTLNADEFFVALKLISFAQNGMPVNLESIARNVQSPLPKITDMTQTMPPMMQQQIAQPQQQQQIVQPQQLQQPQQLLQPQQPQQQPQQLQPQQKQQQLLTTPPQQIPQQNQQQLFELSEEKKVRYGGFFQKFDNRNQGFLEQQDMRQLFNMTQLPQEIINLVWEQVDFQKRGCLTKPEFIVTMHLLDIAKMNIQLPKVLQPSLKNYILQNSTTISAVDKC